MSQPRSYCQYLGGDPLFWLFPLYKPLGIIWSRPFNRFYKWGNYGPEGVYDLSKVTQEVTCLDSIGSYSSLLWGSRRRLIFLNVHSVNKLMNGHLMLLPAQQSFPLLLATALGNHPSSIRYRVSGTVLQSSAPFWPWNGHVTQPRSITFSGAFESWGERLKDWKRSSW